MRRYRNDKDQNGVHFFVDELRSFLEKRGLDFIYIQLGISFFDNGSVSSVSDSLIFFKDGKEGSLFFPDICEFESSAEDKEYCIDEKIKEILYDLNKCMFSYTSKYWRFMTIKLDDDGKICVKFYYDLSEGKGVAEMLEEF